MKTTTRNQGFTLIELLTVIAIIGILAAILVPVVGRVREQANRAKCGSNVRQIAVALINYANQDKHQRFPNANEGAWPWDLQKSIIKLLVDTSGRGVVFCPSGAENENDERFSFGGNTNVSSGYAVISYVVMIANQSQAAGDENAGHRRIRAKYVNERMVAPYNTKINNPGTDVQAMLRLPSSQRELVADAVITEAGRYDNITAGGLAGKDRTNHMTGKLPSGANIGFMDGHIAWRNFDRTAFFVGGNAKTVGSPAFGW